MRDYTILLSLIAALTATGCKTIECADGTVERDGICEPGDKATDEAKCGPFTELQGDQCVPMFPPTECDPNTTSPDTDPETGVTTCIGMGGPSGCDSKLACPTPTGSTKQTICGQLYDFETGLPFAAAGATGQMCDSSAPASSGPCALSIGAYNAFDFAHGMGGPLPVEEVYIDDCGRYRLKNIETQSAGPFVGLGVDDAAGMGPDGVTVTAAVAEPTGPMTATKDFDAFIVKPSTAAAWGNNLLNTGIYALVFRAHKEGVGDASELQPGVQITFKGVPQSSNDFYFEAAATTRTTIDTGATMTGANGTGLINNASVDDLTVWAGSGGIADTTNCVWESHAGASLPGVVFVQIFRKTNAFGKTCNE